MKLIDISKVVKVDLDTFFNDYIIFISQFNQVLVDYYTNNRSYPKSAFDSLDKLLLSCTLIYQQIELCKDSLRDYFCFIVIDQVEECYTTLQIINNYSRWLRSTFIKGRFKETIEIDFVLRQNQTLENLSSEVGYIQEEQGALELALRNHIQETDYNLNGGLIFRFNYQNEQSIVLNTVVDSLSGENLLGKDISKKFLIEEDDLLTLSPKDTFIQTCGILVGLLKNTNPEFPIQGFNKATISNRNGLSNTLPTFIRQLYATVRQDDTITSFEVSKISIEQDVLRIEVDFRSHLNLEVKQVIYGN